LQANFDGRAELNNGKNVEEEAETEIIETISVANENTSERQMEKTHDSMAAGDLKRKRLLLRKTTIGESEK
jgi:hypothetical protein